MRHAVMAYPLSVTRIKLFGRHSEVRSPEGCSSLLLSKMVKKYIFCMQAYSSKPQTLRLLLSP